MNENRQQQPTARVPNHKQCNFCTVATRTEETDEFLMIAPRGGFHGTICEDCQERLQEDGCAVCGGGCGGERGSYGNRTVESTAGSSWSEGEDYHLCRGCQTGVIEKTGVDWGQ